MDNQIMQFVEAVITDGLHPTAVSVQQVTTSTHEVRVTVQDWIIGPEGGDECGPHNNVSIDRKNIPQGVSLTEMSRYPDQTILLTGTSIEMIDQWMMDVAKSGDAKDVARFDYGNGDLRWLTLPKKWRRQ
jgi:hypothetical protein